MALLKPHDEGARYFRVVKRSLNATFHVNIFVSYVKYLYILIKKVARVYCSMNGSST